jgi:hypothetical protein
MKAMTNMNGVTRRSLLQTGGGAALVALIGAGPWSTAKALAAAGAPPYLLRSSYLPLVGDSFSVGSSSLRLDEVSGELEDVFGLIFSGDLDQGIHELRHPQLGRFELFIAPVGAATDRQAVIDRSVKLRQAIAASPSPPPAREQPAQAQAPAAEVDTATPKGVAQVAHVPAHRPLLRHTRMRRAGHGLRCELKLRHRVKRADVRLLRSGRTVARGHRKHRGDHLTVRLTARHRLPAGSYELLVITTDLRGRVTSQVTTVRIP